MSAGYEYGTLFMRSGDMYVTVPRNVWHWLDNTKVSVPTDSIPLDTNRWVSSWRWSYHCKCIVYEGADAKVCYLGLSFQVDQYIRWFDIPVNLRDKHAT